MNDDPDAQTIKLPGWAVRFMLGMVGAAVLVGAAASLLPEVVVLHAPYDLFLSLAGGCWAVLGRRKRPAPPEAAE